MTKMVTKKIMRSNIKRVEYYLMYKNIPIKNKNNINNLLNKIKLYICISNVNNKQLNYIFNDLNNVVVELYNTLYNC